MIIKILVFVRVVIAVLARAFACAKAVEDVLDDVEMDDQQIVPPKAVSPAGECRRVARQRADGREDAVWGSPVADPG